MMHHDTLVRVRYADTDQMGVVHHAAFLEYFEEGRSDWLRSTGLPYAEIEARGVYLVVTQATVRYRLPAHYDELLTVRTRLLELRRASLVLGYECLREHTLLVEASTRLAAIDRNRRPIRLPSELSERLAAALTPRQDGATLEEPSNLRSHSETRTRACTQSPQRALRPPLGAD